MTFSLLLTAILLFMGVYTVVFMSRRVAWLLLPCYVFGVVLIWQPQLSTFLARSLGIGRGLDLFLMLMTVILINGIIVIARHISLLHQKHTELARNIALYRAGLEYGTDTGTDTTRQHDDTTAGQSGRLREP